MSASATMKQKLYSVKDMKIGAFGPVIFFRTDAEAIRSFGDFVADGKDTMASKHPEDFAMYYLGEMDLETGVIYQSESESLRLLATGDSFGAK